MANHNNVTDGNVHTPYRQVFADDAARTGDGTVYTAADLYKKSYQVDTAQNYTLTAIGPTTWTADAGGDGGPPVASPDVPTIGKTVIVNHTTVGPNVVVGSPPAGFVRRCLLGALPDQPRISVKNTGGIAAQFNFFINTEQITRRDSDLDAGQTEEQPGLFYLDETQELRVLLTTAANNMQYIVSYADWPISLLKKITALPTLAGSPNILVPVPSDTSKAHMLDTVQGGGAGPGFLPVNFNGAGTINFTHELGAITGLDPASVDLNQQGQLSWMLTPGLAITDDSGPFRIAVDADGIFINGAYWVLDKAQ